MSIFDYIGLTICGVFFIIGGGAAISDLFTQFRPNYNRKWIMFPICLLIILGSVSGLFWIYNY